MNAFKNWVNQLKLCVSDKEDYWKETIKKQSLHIYSCNNDDIIN